jgi:hypothetical protein
VDIGLAKKVVAVSLVTAVAGLLGQACNSSTASAQTDSAVLGRDEALSGDARVREGYPGDRHHAIEGAWISQVAITNCQGTTERQFQALNLFHAGGTLTDTDNQPPATHGPAFGTWRSHGDGMYSSVFVFYRFNSDGSLAGSNRVQRTITLGADRNSFTSTIEVSVLDPSGTSVGSACGAETAARLK